jgi:hypothetical protein
MQVIDPTFQANKVTGHDDIWNPVDNVAAASNYIAGRYGNPSNTPGEVSLARGGSYQGYGSGGLVSGGITVHLGGVTIHATSNDVGQALAKNLGETLQAQLLRYQRNNGSTGIK